MIEGMSVVVQGTKECSSCCSIVETMDRRGYGVVLACRAGMSRAFAVVVDGSRCIIVERDGKAWRWWRLVTRDAARWADAAMVESGDARCCVVCVVSFLHDACVLARAVGGRLLTQQVICAARQFRTYQRGAF